MDFLQCIKLYATKPSNALVNSKTTTIKSETIDWHERLQATRRSIIDQLSRLKIEEMCLRNLAVKNENDQNQQPSKRAYSSTRQPIDEQDKSDESIQNRKRFCNFTSNHFNIEVINQTELDLDL